MALQLGALRDALAEAGASPELARKASEEVAGYENQLNGIKLELSELRSRVTLLTWMVTFNLALTLLVLGKLFGVVGNA